MSRVYVGNLSSRTRERDLEDMFSRYGRVIQCSLKGGFGFIEMSDPRDADECVYRLNGAEMDGCRLRIEHAKGRRDRDGGSSSRGGGASRGGGRTNRSDHRVRVTGIDSKTSWQDLKDFGRDAGTVLFADVYTDNRGDRYGVMEYSTRSDMKEAEYRLDDTRLNGVYVRVRQDRGDSYSRSRSRSRGRSPPRRSTGSRRSKSRSRSASPPPRDAKKVSRSRSRSKSISKGRSRSRSRSRSPVRKSGSPPPKAALRSPSPSPPRAVEGKVEGKPVEE